MHVGHCRGAVFGDALANLLAFAGYDVTREYYINDAGAQVDVLARSAFLRYREALGEDIGAIPEGLYPGDYLKPVGEALAAEYGDALQGNAGERNGCRSCAPSAIDDDDGDDPRRSRGAQRRARCVLLRALADRGPATTRSARPSTSLRAQGDVYEGRLPPPKGAPVEDWEDREQTLFRATDFGDDVDRPLMKSDGSYTYFASDIAYHKTKFDRGFRDHDRRVGRRPWRLRQAHAGGGEGGQRRQGRARRQDRAAGEAAARRRAGEDVEAVRRLRHACAKWSTRSAATPCAS